MPSPWAWLTRHGPLGLELWQWLAALGVIFASAGIGWVLSRLVRSALAQGARRTATTWDDTIIERIAGPLTAAFSVGAAMLLLPFLGLDPDAEGSFRRVARAAWLVTFFWLTWRMIDVGHLVALRSSWAHRVPSSRALIPLGARSGKVLVLAIALIAILSLFGYPVASLLAGLGLGGLAVALAAQKTVENLFGAFSIGVDQPFREGDFVKIEDFVGTVEAIGLRSTRFRTLDRTIISIPNGKLADMRLESFTERDRLRLSAIVGVVYGTTASQLRSLLVGFETVLRGHPRIWPDAVVVRFREFAASSLDIEVMAWFQTTDWSEFQSIREEVLLNFMDVVEGVGTSFAFPTRTVHLVREPAPVPA